MQDREHPAAAADLEDMGSRGRTDGPRAPQGTKARAPGRRRHRRLARRTDPRSQDGAGGRTATPAAGTGAASTLNRSAMRTSALGSSIPAEREVGVGCLGAGRVPLDVADAEDALRERLAQVPRSGCGRCASCAHAGSRCRSDLDAAVGDQVARRHAAKPADRVGDDQQDERRHRKPRGRHTTCRPMSSTTQDRDRQKRQRSST